MGPLSGFLKRCEQFIKCQDFDQNEKGATLHGSLVKKVGQIYG